MQTVKKFCLALLALGMFVGSTDGMIATIVGMAPKGLSLQKTFWTIALIANIQAFIWYQFGHLLVAVLADCHKSMLRIWDYPHWPMPVWWSLGLITKGLSPFAHWEQTRAKAMVWTSAFLKSKKGMATSTLAWLFVPGSRAITAIFFGMESWRGGFVLLLVMNTIHVAISFGFWGILFSSLRWLIRLF